MEFFVSDDTDPYYNAWCSAFSRSDKKLLYSWHMDSSWHQKLNEFIKDKEQQAEVYEALKNLQNETIKSIFRRSLQQFLAWLKGISPEITSYFDKEYASQKGILREGLPTNTNMFLESFHRTQRR